jgi:hypothetical protein
MLAGRLVLEVGVEDRGVVAARGTQRGAYGGALALVAVMEQDADALRPRGSLEDLA